MFEIGWTELLVIALVAIVVIGPKDLPRAMRTVGQWSGKLKRMAREFQGQFNEAMKEAELDGVKKDLESLGKIDPLAGVRKEMTKLDIRNDLAKPIMGATTPKPTPPVETPKVEP